MYELPRADDLVQTEWEIKRSRFISFISRVRNEEEARQFISDIKHAYPDARHHCSAYLYHVDNSNPVERSSDDGEPSGTAGAPILDVLRGSGMLDIACVVVRYFGGIKLGAGGLVHAYSHSASLALAEVKRMQRSRQQLISVELPPADAGRTESQLRAKGVHVHDIAYGQQVTLTLAVAPEKEEALIAQLAALTAGAAKPKRAGESWMERPAP